VRRLLIIGAAALVMLSAGCGGSTTTTVTQAAPKPKRHLFHGTPQQIANFVGASCVYSDMIAGADPTTADDQCTQLLETRLGAGNPDFTVAEGAITAELQCIIERGTESCLPKRLP
jgi:hypothetical protein